MTDITVEADAGDAEDAAPRRNPTRWTHRSRRAAERKLPPAPAEIATARRRAGLRVVDSAAMVGIGWRAWFRWEAGEARMPWAAWQLYLILLEVRRQESAERESRLAARQAAMPPLPEHLSKPPPELAGLHEQRL